MKKTRIILPLIVIFTIVCVFTAAIGWGPTGTGAARNIITGLDLSGGVSITYEADSENPDASDMDDTIWKLQQRVQNYSTEANVYKEGSNRINVEIPGVTDATAILRDLGTPGSLYFIAHANSEGVSNYSFGENGYQLDRDLDELEKDGSIVCVGADIEDAQGSVTQDSVTKNNEYVVELSFTKDGTKKFADATKDAYEKGDSIGIYYDGRFVSVPVVNAVITDGKAVIEGMESIEEAKELASFIRIGGLKVTLNELRSNVVGAQLGSEAIRTSLIGGAIGLAIVCIIMIAVYLLPGALASFALILYISLMLILLNAFDITLTLPGIAGIILGIGMAVDANVVIFSRMQEEISKGSSAENAVQNGFKKALSAIVDGNVTTLIAAGVLGIFGTGTIKGFAITLAMSVALSMFTALFVTKTLCECMLSLGFKDTKLWARNKKDTSIDFVANFKKIIAIPLAICLLGAIFMAKNSAGGKNFVNLSMDFTGGTATTITMNEDLSQEEIEKQLSPIVDEVIGESGTGVSFQKAIGSNDIIVKTRTMSVDERDAFAKMASEKLGVDESAISAESISATIGKEMRKNAIISVIIAIILMLLYIFIRFKDIRFALSAIIALCHDILIVFMAYAIFRISVGNAFIAVMLTILGYSINSTIVIFDRIRELLPSSKSRKINKREVVNRAVNMTLTRSIFTNLTTLASILALFVIGVASVKEFTLPIMTGIVAGAFSSVFLTGPIWYFMKTARKTPADKVARRM